MHPHPYLCLDLLRLTSNAPGRDVSALLEPPVAQPSFIFQPFWHLLHDHTMF